MHAGTLVLSGICQAKNRQNPSIVAVNSGNKVPFTAISDSVMAVNAIAVITVPLRDKSRGVLMHNCHESTRENSSLYVHGCMHHIAQQLVLLVHPCRMREVL